MTLLKVLESQVPKILKEAEERARAGLFDAALELCSSVIEQHPDSHRAYEVRSSVFRKSGDLDRAVEDISSVVRLKPSNAAPLFRRGRYQMMRSSYAEAIEDFSKAITLDTGYFGDALRFYRAEACLRAKRFAEALSDCRAIGADYSERSFFGHTQRSKADIEREAEAGMRQSKP